MLFHKFFWIFRKKRIFHFFQNLVKITFLVKFDLGYWKSIGNKGGRLSLDLPVTFFRKIFKKLKISVFSEKKLQLKKFVKNSSQNLAQQKCGKSWPRQILVQPECGKLAQPKNSPPKFGCWPSFGTSTKKFSQSFDLKLFES